MGRSPEPIRSLLFLPATRPDRLDRALASGADRVCVDLEDGVGPDAKAAAREAVVRLATEDHALARLVIRINSPRTEEGLRDVLAIRGVAARPLAIMTPKVESAEELRWIEELLASRHPDLRFIVLIETARAIEAASRIAASSARIDAVMFGGVDLSAEIGATLEWEPLLHARSTVVIAATRAGVGALDSVMLDIDAADAVHAEAARARSLGFTGKAAIHPKQIAPIHDAFAPTAGEVALAHRIVAAYEQSRGGATALDGRLVDLPVLRSAQRILQLARAGDDSAT